MRRSVVSLHWAGHSRRRLVVAAALAGAAAVTLLLGSGCDDFGTPVTRCGDNVCDPTTEDYLSCPDDCYGICGNGVTDPGEECDGEDFGGLRCQDRGCGHGALACSAACELIESGCGSPCGTYCGDGVVEDAEQCDCGVDPDGLPTLCAAPNGHLLSACGEDCAWTIQCGNQVTDAGEECDCGIDPDHLPTGCTLPNGFAQGECTASCHWNEGSCFLSLSDNIMCDPSGPDGQCCPDDWGHPARCVQTDATTTWCLMDCQTTADCHYNHSCDPSLAACLPALCGPTLTGESYFGLCQVPGGRDGICLPFGLAEEDIGQCLENSPNAISPRDSCPSVHLQTSFPRDVSMDTCFNGACLAWNPNSTAECLSICDWEDVYDNLTNSSWCGLDTNCIAESFITPDHPNPAVRGLRDADLSYCRPTRDEDDLYGVTACDLLTDELITDRGQVCDGWRAGTHCRPAMVVEAGVVATSWGALIGNCLEPNGGPAVGVWQTCDPDTDDCAANTACFPADAFAASPSGPYRCVPLCDTAAPNPCAPAHPTVPATNVCTSLSAHFRPGATPGSSEDGSPTRVGLCALVPQ